MRTVETYSGVYEAILARANELSERVAIVDHDGDRTTTWKELGTLIVQIADYAVALGLTGVVPVVQGRTMEYIATVLGLKLAGVAVSPLSNAFKRPISVVDIKENNTVEKLESFFAAPMQEEVFEIQEEYPLTKTQEGIFFECLGKPDSTFYNIPSLLKLSERIEIDRLKGAILMTIHAHPYLMTTLFLSEEGVRCKRDPNAHFEASDIEEMTVDSIDDVRASLCKPFALQGGRLFRVALIHSKEDTFLYTDVHHIVFDGASLALLRKEISRAYDGKRRVPETAPMRNTMGEVEWRGERGPQLPLSPVCG